MPDTRLLVMAAAVADFIPQPLAGEKVSRHDGPVQLTLTPAEDLLAGIAARRTPGQTLVGFALEAAGDLPDRALAKMQRKSVDAIVANPLETMDAATISATLMCADGRTFEAQPHMPKAAFARWLLDTLEQAFLA